MKKWCRDKSGDLKFRTFQLTQFGHHDLTKLIVTVPYSQNVNRLPHKIKLCDCHKGRFRIYGLGAEVCTFRRLKTRPPCRKPKKIGPPAGGQKKSRPPMILQLKNKMS